MHDVNLTTRKVKIIHRCHAACWTVGVAAQTQSGSLYYSHQQFNHVAFSAWLQNNRVKFCSSSQQSWPPALPDTLAILQSVVSWIFKPKRDGRGHWVPASIGELSANTVTSGACWSSHSCTFQQNKSQIIKNTMQIIWRCWNTDYDYHII